MSRTPPPTDENWPATWDVNRQAQLKDALDSTPAERLAWLEEALELVEATEQARRKREGSSSL